MGAVEAEVNAIPRRLMEDKEEEGFLGSGVAGGRFVIGREVCD